MLISSLYDRGEPLFSLEFFPPKDDVGADRLFAAITALRELEPAFVSVTHGAGESRRDDRSTLNRSPATHVILSAVRIARPWLRDSKSKGSIAHMSKATASA